MRTRGRGGLGPVARRAEVELGPGRRDHGARTFGAVRSRAASVTSTIVGAATRTCDHHDLLEARRMEVLRVVPAQPERVRATLARRPSRRARRGKAHSSRSSRRAGTARPRPRCPLVASVDAARCSQQQSTRSLRERVDSRARLSIWVEPTIRAAAACVCVGSSRRSAPRRIVHRRGVCA